MKLTRRQAMLLGVGLTLTRPLRGSEDRPGTWPPPLRGNRDGTVTLRSDEFLTVPEAVETARRQEGTAPFTVARTAPTVDLAFHQDLGPNAVGRRLWSSWGDIA